MALALNADFTREAGNGASAPVFLVNVGSLAGGKFTDAPRPVFGYPHNVSAVNSRSSSIDPVTGDQTLSSVTVEFVDDGLVRALIKANNNLVGKDLTVTLGFDTGSDATYPEGSYVGYLKGVIDKYEVSPGKITLSAKDIRGEIWDRLSSTQFIPLFGVHGTSKALAMQANYEGCATVALRQMMLDGGIPASWINSASFDPANNPKTGHLVIDRRRLPDPRNYTHLASPPTTLAPGEAASDRRIHGAKPMATRVKEILQILRSHLLVQEDGIAQLKEHDPTVTPTDRFVAADIVPESFKCWLDRSNIITTAQIRTLFEGLTAAGGPGFRFMLRDKDTGAQTSYGFTSGDQRNADFSLEDEWFSGIIFRNTQGGVVTNVQTTIAGLSKFNDNFTGQGRNAPLAVSASAPMYCWLFGPDKVNDASSAGEIIEVDTVTVNADETFTFSSITRGKFGTTARQHGLTTSAHGVNYNYDIILIDCTAVMRCIDQILREFKDGAVMVEFKSPLSRYAPQVTDPMYLESDVFVGAGVDTLPIGNTSLIFKILAKDVDPKSRIITYRLMLVNNPSRTPSVGDNAHGNSAPYNQGNIPVEGIGLQRIFAPASTGATAGELSNAFVGGGTIDVPSPVSLTYTIPEQVVGSIYGVVRPPEQSRTATASKDTYLDFRPMPGGISGWIVQEVANGGAAPGIATGDMRAWKVVSNGTQVTSVTDLRNKQSVGSGTIVDGAITNVKVSGTAAIDGSKLKEGSGPLTHVSSAGVFDSLANVTTRTLDQVNDGTAWLKVANVSANLVQTSSIANLAITSGLIADANITTAKINSSAVDNTKIANNAVRSGHFDSGSHIPCNWNFGSDGTETTGSTTTPYDDTTPLSTEGTQFDSITITKSGSTTNSTYLFWEQSQEAASAATYITGAFFTSTTCRGASGHRQIANGNMMVYMTMGDIVSNSSSSQTVNYRAGADSAAVVTWLGQASASKYSTTLKAFIVIMEFAV